MTVYPGVSLFDQGIPCCVVFPIKKHPKQSTKTRIKKTKNRTPKQYTPNYVFLFYLGDMRWRTRRRPTLQRYLRLCVILLVCFAPLSHVFGSFYTPPRKNT
ncbi:unnamed protein product [Ectocarpus sp. 12 AP-2014]